MTYRPELNDYERSMNVTLYAYHRMTRNHANVLVPGVGINDGNVAALADAYYCRDGQCFRTTVLVRGTEDDIASTLAIESLKNALRFLDENAAFDNIDRSWCMIRLVSDQSPGVWEASMVDALSLFVSINPKWEVPMNAFRHRIQICLQHGWTPSFVELMSNPIFESGSIPIPIASQVL